MSLGITELSTLDNLAAQLVATFVRGIQPQLHVTVAQADKVVHQRATITAQSRSIAHDALSVNTYYHGNEE